MIEDPQDHRRSSRGRHHGSRHDGPGCNGWKAEPVMPAGLLGMRQVAVQLDGTDASVGRLELAAHLAVCLDAELVGVGESVPADACAASALECRFRAAVASRPGLRVEWRSTCHDALREMVGHGRTADLTVLGQTPPGGEPPAGFAAEEVVIACGRPCLIVPARGHFDHVGQNVAVAWDGSREAARALSDALPLLRDASSVLVIEVGARSTRGGPDQPGADRAVGVLQRHGVQAFAEFVEVAGERVADAFADRIAGSDVDLVVAGLFAHSPTRERIMGGTSYDFLARMIVPMLVSH